jgi:hypothetical protein
MTTERPMTAPGTPPGVLCQTMEPSLSRRASRRPCCMFSTSRTSKSPATTLFGLTRLPSTSTRQTMAGREISDVSPFREADACRTERNRVQSIAAVTHTNSKTGTPTLRRFCFTLELSARVGRQNSRGVGPHREGGHKVRSGGTGCNVLRGTLHFRVARRAPRVWIVRELVGNCARIFAAASRRRRRGRSGRRRLARGRSRRGGG